MKEKWDDRSVALLLEQLRRRGETITAVESCTGGLLAARITDIPGSSDVFRQSFITYCDQAKHQLAGVKKSTLKNHTAVSKQTARQMAKGGAKKAKADACLSVTGYAGPPADETDTTVGLVYLGCFYRGQVWSKKLQLPGDRRQVRERAVEEALQFLKECAGFEF